MKPDMLDDILQFRDEPISEEEFEGFLRAAVQRGRQFDFSQWIRDKDISFYFGMLSAVKVYKIIHKRFGLVLEGPDGVPFDDQLGQELTLVIKSILK